MDRKALTTVDPSFPQRRMRREERKQGEEDGKGDGTVLIVPHVISFNNGVDPVFRDGYGEVPVGS